MRDIKIGEYVRDTEGEIYKADKIFLNHANVEVKKHSFNIIDLIEEDDYVNRLEIEKIIEPTQYTNYKKTLYCSESEGLYKGVFFNNDIKSVVTHEQMEAMEYEVK